MKKILTQHNILIKNGKIAIFLLILILLIAYSYSFFRIKLLGND